MGLEVHLIDFRATTDQPSPPHTHTHRGAGKNKRRPPPCICYICDLPAVPTCPLSLPHCLSPGLCVLRCDGVPASPRAVGGGGGGVNPAAEAGHQINRGAGRATRLSSLVRPCARAQKSGVIEGNALLLSQYLSAIRANQHRIKGKPRGAGNQILA
jgi:hypothetical protein